MSTVARVTSMSLGATLLRFVAVVALACVSDGARPQSAAAARAVAADAPLQQSVEGLLRLGDVAPFGRPVVMESRIGSAQVGAALEGLIDRPFRHVLAALSDAPHWCAVLILHINNKGCVVMPGPNARIGLKVARRYDQPVDQAYQMDFDYRVLAASAAELSVRLDAPNGPFGTSDYGIHLDAVPAGESRTAVRLSYSYRQGTMAGWAMDLYMSTAGRGKVGFSGLPQAGGEPPQYVGGVRGLLERNLMRYFLAIDVAAGTPVVAGADDYARRLHDWFAATDRYPRQLHEVDLGTYLSLKHSLQTVGVPHDAQPSHRPP